MKSRILENQKEESDILLNSGSLLKVRKRKISESGYSNWMARWHPYTVSCAIFSLAIYVTEKLFDGPYWSARKTYFFFKDFLLNQTILIGENVPQEIKEMAKNILNYFSESECDTNIRIFMEQLLNFFGDIHSMLMKQHRLISTQRMKVKDGHLQSFSVVGPEEFKSITNRDFHPYHLNKNKNRQPGVLHCNCKSDKCKGIVIKFDRKKVSPIQLFTSMGIIEKRFSVSKKDNLSYWTIIFTKYSTLLITEEDFLCDITKNYLLDILVQNSYIKRQLPLPIYYLHLHNYFNGSDFGVISCMKFMLKCFCFGRHFEKKNQDNDMMLSTSKEDDIPLIEYYKLIHLIIEKFETKENLIYNLTLPYKKEDIYLWKNKKGACGMREDITSIYSALRAFVLVKTRHFILKRNLKKLYEVFMEKRDYQFVHKQLFDVIRELVEIADTTQDTEYVEIYQSDSHDIPSHVLFYFFCAHPDVENNLAINTFLSICVLVKTHTRIKSATASSFITFSVPPIHSELLKDKWRLGLLNLACFKLSKKKKEEEDIELDQPHTGFSILLQCLEELYCKKFEERKNYGNMDNYISLTSSFILSDKRQPPKIPIDVEQETKYPIYMDEALPIWKSGIFDSSLVEKSSHEKRILLEQEFFLQKKRQDLY